MKKWIFSAALVWWAAAFLTASPWGIDSPQAAPFFLAKVAAREPLTVCVDGAGWQETSTAPLGEALSRWLRSVYSRIEESGRMEEFKDLQTVLTNPVVITPQPCSKNAAIEKQYEKYLRQGSLARGYAFAPVQEDLRVILLPAQAVADLSGNAQAMGYLVPATAQTPAVLALNRAADVKELWQGVGGSLAMPRTSAKKSKPYMIHGGADFSCADLDDFILGLDCLAGLRPRRGGAAGWKSFCPRSLTSYVNCKAQGGWKKTDDKALPSRAVYDVWRQVALRKQDLDPAVMSGGYDPAAREDYTQTRKDSQGRLTYARRGPEEYFWTYEPRFTRVKSLLNGELLHETDIIQTPRYLSIERKAGGKYRRAWSIDFLADGALSTEEEELADGAEKVFARKVSFAVWTDSREETYDEPDLNLNTTVLRPNEGTDGEWIVVKTDRKTRYAGLRVELDENGPRGLEEYVPMRPQTFLRGERMLPFETRFGENGPAPDFHSEFTRQNLLRDARESRLYAQRFRQLMYNFYPGLDLSGAPLQSFRREAGKSWYRRKPGASPRIQKFVPKK